jgi:pSer/pThr/pTyr-binding forkhead associated (FHA) protein
VRSVFLALSHLKRKRVVLDFNKHRITTARGNEVIAEVSCLHITREDDPELIEHEILELKIDTGNWAGQKYSIPFGALRTVGRERGADFIVEVDPTISRVHFEISFNQMPPQIKDRGSSNGTFLNGRKISQRESLQHGDIVRAGHTTFSIHVAPVVSNDFENDSHGQYSRPVEPLPVQSVSKSALEPGQEWPSLLPEPLIDEVEIEQVQGQHGDLVLPNKGVETSEETGSSGFSFDFIHEKDKPKPHEAAKQKAASEDGPIWVEPFPEVDDPLPEPWVDASDENPVEEPYPTGIDLSDFDNYESSSPSDGSRSVVANSSPQSKVRQHLDNTGLRRFRLHKSPEFAYPAFLRSIFEQCEFLVVAHFRKIGKSRPVELEPIELFPNVSPLDGVMPMAFFGDDWSRFADHSLTRELVANDAIVTLLGRDCVSLARILNQGALPGFSVADGFIGWYWPSQLKLMLNSSSDSSIANWFRSESLGLVFPNNPESCIDCIMYGQSNYDIESLGFDRTQR